MTEEWSDSRRATGCLLALAFVAAFWVAVVFVIGAVI